MATMACFAVTNAPAKLVVVKAVFGVFSDPATTVDVTSNVEAMVKNDELNVEVGANIFIDPALGKIKRLKVDYTIDGVAGSKLATEGATLRISARDKPDSTNLVIRSAVYGNLTSGKTNDVATILAAMVKNDGLDVVVNNDTFPDPALELRKKLFVDYTFNGRQKSTTVIEGDRLKISASDQPDSVKLTIRKAEYASLLSDKATDVTAIAAAMVEQGALEVEANNVNFQDPALETKKKLRVDYTFNGEARSKTVLEHEWLKISSTDKPGSSNLVIRAAVYGNLSSGKTNDVTAFLAALVENDALDVKVSAENFGDPAPGASQKLRVDYTLNGEERSKIIIQGDQLNISARDDAAKSAQSRLVIRKAEYGRLPDGKANDVTAIVAAMIEQDALDVKVSNDNFDDPTPEAKKKLRVDYTFDGEDRSKTVIEGDRLKISPTDKSAAAPKFHSSKLFIREADYGVLPDGNFNDVTAIVAALVENDALDVEVSNESFDDPAPQARKKLRVNYTFNGEERSKTVVEHERLKISPNDKSAGKPKLNFSRLVIRRAEYGDLPDGNFDDVTAIVAALVEKDALEVKVGSDNFDDPALKRRKLLHVAFTFDGDEGAKTVAEGVTLRISARDTTAAQAANASKLVIAKAVYGDLEAGKTRDVTTLVSAMVQNDTLDEEVNSDNFQDPAPEAKKKLRVDYTFNGEARFKTAWEHDRIKISPGDKPGSSNLVIRAAVYGDLAAGKTSDVTAILTAMIDNDALDLEVNNYHFDDPAPKARKKLQVDYFINGEEHSKTIAEHDRLKISPNDRSAGTPKSSSSRLVIRQAKYGDLPDGSFNDVTAMVAAMIEKDALNVKVDNDSFDDPALLRKKRLLVDYIFDGEKKFKTVEEGQQLTINTYTERKRGWVWAVVAVFFVIAASGGVLVRKWKK